MLQNEDDVEIGKDQAPKRTIINLGKIGGPKVSKNISHADQIDSSSSSQQQYVQM